MYSKSNRWVEINIWLNLSVFPVDLLEKNLNLTNFGQAMYELNFQFCALSFCTYQISNCSHFFSMFAHATGVLFLQCSNDNNDNNRMNISGRLLSQKNNIAVSVRIEQLPMEQLGRKLILTMFTNLSSCTFDVQRKIS